MHNQTFQIKGTPLILHTAVSSNEQDVFKRVSVRLLSLSSTIFGSQALLFIDTSIMLLKCWHFGNVKVLHIYQELK